MEQEQRQHEILHPLKAVEVEQDRVNTPCKHKYSIVGFANLQGLGISVKVASAKGRLASALCRKQDIEIERIHDPRFGKVGLYPEVFWSRFLKPNRTKSVNSYQGSTLSTGKFDAIVKQ